MMLPVFQYLISKEMISLPSSELISLKCRDAEVNVYKDMSSELIFLDPHYERGATHYYQNKAIESLRFPRSDMDHADTLRRDNYLSSFISGKFWCDFGCGLGYQLRQSAKLASNHLGIELNEDNLNMLSADGFNVSDTMESLQTFKPQVISLFHVLEHLDDPLSVLRKLYETSDDRAVLIVEVPHARDMLIAKNDDFRSFAFWTEHFVLHTKASLKSMIQDAGWQLTELVGVQRYPVWNHLSWLTEGKPTGLKSAINDGAARNLAQAYEQYLVSRDMTDTLLAVAIKQRVKE